MVFSYHVSGIPIIPEFKVEKLKVYFYSYFLYKEYSEFKESFLPGNWSMFKFAEFISDKLKIDMMIQNGYTTGIMFLQTESDLLEFDNKQMDKSHFLRIGLI